MHLSAVSNPLAPLGPAQKDNYAIPPLIPFSKQSVRDILPTLLSSPPEILSSRF